MTSDHCPTTGSDMVRRLGVAASRYVFRFSSSFFVIGAMLTVGWVLIV